MVDNRLFRIILCFFCWPGYLSSPHAGQEPPFSRDAQQGAVISSPVVPAAASGQSYLLLKSLNIYLQYINLRSLDDVKWFNMHVEKVDFCE